MMKLVDGVEPVIGLIDTAKLLKVVADKYNRGHCSLAQVITCSARLQTVLKISGLVVPDFVNLTTLITAKVQQSVYKISKDDSSDFNSSDTSDTLDATKYSMSPQVTYSGKITELNSSHGDDVIASESCRAFRDGVANCTSANTNKQDSPVAVRDDLEANCPQENQAESSDVVFFPALTTEYNDSLSTMFNVPIYKHDEQNISLRKLNVLVHLKPRETWSNAYDLISLFSGYPISHSTEGKGCTQTDYVITTFVVATEPYFGYDATLKLFTTYSNKLLQPLDSKIMLSCCENHGKLISEIVMHEVVEHKTLAVHIDNDFTMLNRPLLNGLILSEQPNDKILRNVRVYTTFHNKTTGNVIHVNDTVYSSKQHYINGSPHPRYDAYGYVFKVTDIEKIESTVNLKDLLDLSYKAKSYQ